MALTAHDLRRHSSERPTAATGHGVERLNDLQQLLKRGSIVDATIITAPSEGRWRTRRDAPDEEGNQWHFGTKAHIGVDADSDLVHTVTTTAANKADVEQVADLLHGMEEHAGLTHTNRPP